MLRGIKVMQLKNNNEKELSLLASDPCYKYHSQIQTGVCLVPIQEKVIGLIM